MNRKPLIALVVLAIVAVVGAGVFYYRGSGPRASVKVALRLAVSPKDQAGHVAAVANSARFKYEIGKKAALKPVLAQKLAVNLAPDSSVIQVEIGVQTKEEGQLYADSFVEMLQAQCGGETKILLVQRSIR